MTDPITPPPELVQQWAHEWNTLDRLHPDAGSTISYVAIRAAQWGADQELEACRMEIIDGAGCVYIDETRERVRLADGIRDARRPKPPSLKEQSLALINLIQGNKKAWDIRDLDVVRRALEQLDD